jgi:hypothetical protein
VTALLIFSSELHATSWTVIRVTNRVEIIALTGIFSIVALQQHGYLSIREAMERSSTAAVSGEIKKEFSSN